MASIIWPKKKILYWAYGSNLCVESMSRRCPAAKKLGRLTVQDAALVFRGVADVVVREGLCVPGGLWEVTERCERELDRYEGVSSGFYLKRYLTIKRKGKDKPEQVLFYQMKMSRGIMPPSQAYLDVISNGYKDFGIDTSYLDAALQESWGNKKVTPILRERHKRKGEPTLARSIAPEATA